MDAAFEEGYLGGLMWPLLDILALCFLLVIGFFLPGEKLR